MTVNKTQGFSNWRKARHTGLAVTVVQVYFIGGRIGASRFIEKIQIKKREKKNFHNKNRIEPIQRAVDVCGSSSRGCGAFLPQDRLEYSLGGRTAFALLRTGVSETIRGMTIK